VSIALDAALVRILMEALQVFVEVLVLGPGMRAFVEFLMRFRQVLMKSLLCSAST